MTATLALIRFMDQAGGTTFFTPLTVMPSFVVTPHGRRHAALTCSPSAKPELSSDEVWRSRSASPTRIVAGAVSSTRRQWRSGAWSWRWRATRIGSTARWMRTGAPGGSLALVLGGYQQGRAATSGTSPAHRSRAAPARAAEFAEVFVQPRQKSVQGVCWRTQVHDPLPRDRHVGCGEFSVADETAHDPDDVVDQRSCRVRLQRVGRLGTPMSSLAWNTISLPSAALTHRHEPSKTAASPSS